MYAVGLGGANNGVGAERNEVVVALTLLDLYEPRELYAEIRQEYIDTVLAQPASKIFDDRDSREKLSEVSLRTKEIGRFIERIGIEPRSARAQHATHLIAALNVMFPDEENGLGTVYTKGLQKKLKNLARIPSKSSK